ncbi:MAG: GntR family transcriptional regulator [Aliidongia sp.]
MTTIDRPAFLKKQLASDLVLWLATSPYQNSRTNAGIASECEHDEYATKNHADRLLDRALARSRPVVQRQPPAGGRCPLSWFRIEHHDGPRRFRGARLVDPRPGGQSSPKRCLEIMMDREWNDSQPIYRQLRDRVVAMILDGVLSEGDPLPSVRTVAAEYRVNPITVLKGYQQLVDEQLVETKRGRGMFINVGARDLLLRGERQKFLTEQWPAIHATIQRLGLTARELLDAASTGTAPSAANEEH